MAGYVIFVFNSIMLGAGLAMDAFSVSLANGFIEPDMRQKRKCCIAGIYAGFQFIMPLAGWFLVHNAAAAFSGFQRLIPWIALALLAFIGGKMLAEGIQEKKCDADGNCKNCTNKECARFGLDKKGVRLTTKALLMQGVATSIDALSVGFTIVGYNALLAVESACIIAIVTYIICFAGLNIGTRFGTKLASNAKILGGLILIGIGIEIFVSGML